VFDGFHGWHVDTHGSTASESIRHGRHAGVWKGWAVVEKNLTSGKTSQQGQAKIAGKITKAHGGFCWDETKNNGPICRVCFARWLFQATERRT
jgi:hypothetical protein